MSKGNILRIATARRKGFSSDFVCSNCMKGALSIINADLPGEVSQNDLNFARKTCGDAFVGTFLLIFDDFLNVR